MNEVKKKRGGARIGAGMPKGYKTHKTIHKEQAREMTRELITRELEPLVKAQIAHAKGIDHFFLRNKTTKQFERVTDPALIELALNTEDPESYHWIFTKDPSVQAFTDLLNRALDKPTEQMKVTGADDGPVEIVVSWKAS